MAVEYQTYFREQGDDWEYVGAYSVPVAILPTVFPFSTSYHTYEWRIDVANDFGITTGDTWTFILAASRYLSVTPRWPDYDPEKVWDEDTGTWIDPEDSEITGGGEYKQQLIVVGTDSVGKGKIYIGEV